MKNEGKTTSVVENQTRQLPSITFLALGLGVAGVSLALMLSGKDRWSVFVGQWVPALLAIGTYNKIVKTFSPPYSEEQRIRHGDNASPLKAPSELRREGTMIPTGV